MFRRTAVCLAVSLTFLGALAGSGVDNASAQSTTTTTQQKAATSAAVAKLQKVMKRLGYYSGPIDGIYGPKTVAGVKAMQEDLGVTVDGIYGAETHQALREQAATAATSIVKVIQTALAKYGYYSGPIDGIYGPETTAAVKELQADLGVTVDGRFGPDTAAAFNEAVANGTLKPA
jgi:peptidoglycan hydrolase-like protein with peptidoglycan-binding domain